MYVCGLPSDHPISKTKTERASKFKYSSISRIQIQIFGENPKKLQVGLGSPKVESKLGISQTAVTIFFELAILYPF